jgi:DNA-directed RNA polymerase subunit RPC12/RpoP
MNMAMDCPACGTGSSISRIPNIYTVCVCPNCETKIIIMKVELAGPHLMHIEAEIFHGEIDPEYWEKRKEE